MKRLKNWDNKTWLSSKKYINSFNAFLQSKINFNKDMQILDIGCGRANIISALQKKYKFNNMAIGIDIVKNKDIKNNILFNIFIFNNIYSYYLGIKLILFLKRANYISSTTTNI